MLRYSASRLGGVVRSDLAGMVANASNSWPTTAQLTDVGVNWVRTIVYDDTMDDLDRALQALPAGLRVVAVLNRERRLDTSVPKPWDMVVSEFARRFAGRVAAVECLNEWDPDADRPVGTAGKYAPAQAVGMALIASPSLRRAGMACLLGSVAGPDWPQQLRQAIGLLSPNGKALLDGVCLHPYGKSADGYPPAFTFGEIDDAVMTAHSIAGLPVWVTEFGIKLCDAAGPQLADESDDAYVARACLGQQQYLTQAYGLLGALPANVLRTACYFAYDDTVGAPTEQGLNAFGLRDPAGAARPAWGAFQSWIAQAQGTTINA